MALWVVRCGRYGERETVALEGDRIGIGWDDLPDLGAVEDRAALEAIIRERHPEYRPATLASHTGQIWAFLRRIEPGALIVMPLKSRSAVAVGEAVGPYGYAADASAGLRHGRPIRWLRGDLPRSALDPDLLQSLGSTLTVFQVSRPDAEARVRALIEGRSPPSPAGKPTDATEAAPAFDLERFAADQIEAHIARRFRGHDLAYLVGAILEAQGYRTAVSPPGPDAGIDILAGRGAMGFDPPRIAVQVKSGDGPVDVGVLRELQGVMTRFGADQGLVVSWGGFTQAVVREARQLFFGIRLWDAGDLIAALAADYDRLPDTIQADIPMKPVWTLMVED